jgi:hypothetical protein
MQANTHARTHARTQTHTHHKRVITARSQGTGNCATERFKCLPVTSTCLRRNLVSVTNPLQAHAPHTLKHVHAHTRHQLCMARYMPRLVRSPDCVLPAGHESDEALLNSLTPEQVHHYFPPPARSGAYRREPSREIPRCASTCPLPIPCSLSF